MPSEVRRNRRLFGRDIGVAHLESSADCVEISPRRHWGPRRSAATQGGAPAGARRRGSRLGEKLGRMPPLKLSGGPAAPKPGSSRALDSRRFSPFPGPMRTGPALEVRNCAGPRKDREYVHRTPGGRAGIPLGRRGIQAPPQPPTPALRMLAVVLFVSD